MNAQQTPTQLDRGSRRVRHYVLFIFGLCVILAAFVLGVTFIRPDAGDDNAALIGVILGLFTPVVFSLLAAARKENHDAMNSRLSQLLELTAKASRAEGALTKQGPSDRTAKKLD
jgi:hypothetical protein